MRNARKIIVAFDSYKGCMTAEEACHTAALAIHKATPQTEVVEIPLSDGGEGLVASVRRFLPVTEVTIQAHGPLMEEIQASYALSVDGRTAYMEMAATSGLPLVPADKRNPENTTTYGVGELILDAARKGCQEIIMGIGGSATCDAGKGMITCLKEHGHDVPCASLPHLTVACDVNNPLFGPQGASYIFAPQKGATPEQVIKLDKQLQEFARETEQAGWATSDLANYPGAGAAGGLGYGLMAYLKAELKSGIDIVLDLTGFNALLKNTDLVITGEGKSDEQTLMGKVPHGILKRCQPAQIPVVLLSGAIDDKDALLSRHFFRVQSINQGDERPLETLLQNEVAKDNLRKTIVTLFQ